MTRLILISAAFGLTLASGASAMNGMTYVPSLWPADGAFSATLTTVDTVTRAQIQMQAQTPMAPAPRPARQDR